MDLNNDTLLTRRQAAEELGSGIRTIDRLRKKGRLTARVAPVGHGLGGTRIFFRREEVEALKLPLEADTTPVEGSPE